MMIKRAICALILILSFATTIFFPLKLKDSSDMFSKKTYKGIITVWQVDSFDGGKGSRKQFLLSLAREYEKLGKLVAESDVLAAAAKLSGDEFAKVFEKIQKYSAEIDKKSKKVRKCDCGKTVSTDALYCPYCGKKKDE